jgi:hypothetical protein
LAQTAIRGNTTKFQGAVTINPGSNPGSVYTHIYALFPPQVNPSGAANHDNFITNVMTQSAIDGVTIGLPWNAVELDSAPPTTTPCSPLGTDVCQQDLIATNYYHTYSWTVVDGTGCTDTTTNSSSQWFCDFPSHDGTGVFKKVNFELFGLGPANARYTPSYVTSMGSATNPDWISATSPGYLHQDVVNVVNAGTACNGYSGASLPANTNWKGNGLSPSTITVTNWTSPLPFVDGDTIWISGFTGTAVAFNVTGQYGAVGSVLIVR